MNGSSIGEVTLRYTNGKLINLQMPLKSVEDIHYVSFVLSNDLNDHHNQGQLTSIGSVKQQKRELNQSINIGAARQASKNTMY